MKHKVWLNLIVLCGLLVALGATAGSSAADGDVILENYTVPDVEAAFDALTDRGEWLGFHPGDAPYAEDICVCTEMPYKDWFGLPDDFPVTIPIPYPDGCMRDPWPCVPGSCVATREQHFQGVARSARVGDPPILYVARAGKPDSSWQPSEGALWVVEMGSRNQVGERLRSNRLEHDKETQKPVPPPTDVVTRAIEFAGVFKDPAGKDVNLDYHHPGGMQMVGDILALALDMPNQKGLPAGKIAFFECSEPVNPQFLGDFDISNQEFGVGAVGITRLPDDHFLVAVYWDDKRLEFYRSNKTDFFPEVGDTVPFSLTHHSEITETALAELDWPFDPEPQSVNFVSEEDGDLYLIASYNHKSVGPIKSEAPILNGTDQLFLWQVTGFESPFSVGLEFVSELDDGQLSPALREEFIAHGHFLAPDASVEVEQAESMWTIHNVDDDNNRVRYLARRENETLDVSPQLDMHLKQKKVPKHLSSAGEQGSDFCDLVLWNNMNRQEANFGASGGAYVSPSGELLYYSTSYWSLGPGGITRMAELRHKHVVRDDSPTYDLTANADGPYVVDEGSSIQLDGRLSHPSTAAPWAQLFEHTDFGGQSVMFDYADRYRDDYDNFAKLDGQLQCADLQAALDLEALLADVTDALTVVIDASENLKREDFVQDFCLGPFWRSDGCWWVPPYEGTMQCEDITVCTGICDTTGVIDWGTPCTVGICPLCVHGTMKCWTETACGPCDPGILTWNTPCTTPGTPAEVVKIPNFAAVDWVFYQQLIALLDLLGRVYFDLGACGLSLDVVGEAPPLPDVLEVLNPDHYGDFDIDDVPTFLANFPFFLRDLGIALTRLPDYLASLDRYFNELLESRKGFNNRASSVRWYAPPGVDIDIVLCEKAGCPPQGERLTLEGSGSVQERRDLHSEGVDGYPSPPVYSGDLFRSMKFVGTFTSPTVESYSWSIESPAPPQPLLLHDATTTKPTFDATSGDGPMTAEVKLVVRDSLGGEGSATTTVTIKNVPPTVEAGQDQVIYEGDVLTLEPATFSDPGTLDTHTAEIDWGDGSPKEPGTVAQSPGSGSVSGSHVYADNRVYTVEVCVKDDDMPDYATEACDTLKVTVVHGFLRFCAYGDYKHDGVTVHQDAVAACALVPSGIPGKMRPSGVGARDKVEVKDRVGIQAILLSLSGKIDVGKDASVSGTLTAGHDVKVDERSHIGDSITPGHITSGHRVEVKRDAWVDGDITAADHVKVDPDATVTGTINEFATVPPMPVITWVQFSIEPGTDKVTVEKDTTLTLPPGAYKDVKVEKGATLILSGLDPSSQDPFGRYVFKKFEMEKGAILQLDLQNGPIVIDVAENLEFKENVQLLIVSTGDARDILFRVAGDKVELKKEGTYLGTFLAPDANVELGDDATLYGALYGKKVDIGQRVYLEGFPARDLFALLFVNP